MIKIFMFLILSIFVVSKNYLPYHAHGFNQTNIIKQLIKKGAFSFKIDFSLSSLQSCLEFGDRKEYPLREIKFDDEMGCIGIIGDMASVPYYQTNFQTAETILDFLDSDEFWVLAQKSAQPIWFELNFKTHNDINFENHLLIDFLDKLIDILDIKGDRIKIGSNICFPILMDAYCIKEKSKYDCEKIPFAVKLRKTKKFSCENNYIMEPYRVYFNVHHNKANEYCEKGFEPFYENQNEFQFWELDSKKNILKTVDKLKKECPKIQGHKFKIASNIDIDQFRISYFYDYKDETQIYSYLKLDNNFKFQNFFYFEKFGFVCLIFTKEQNLILKSYKIVNGALKQFGSQELSQVVSQDKLFKFQNSIFFYTENSIFQFTITQNGNFDFKQFKNKINCEQILFLDDNNYYCINLSKNQKSQYFLKIEKNKKKGFFDGQMKTFKLPQSITKISKLKLTLDQNNIFVGITSIEIDKDQSLKTFSYLIYLNYEKSILSNYFYILGEIENLEIDKSVFIISVNKTQTQYGKGFVNNNEKNICDSKINFNLDYVYRMNEKNHIGYYLGKIKDLENLSKSKFVGYCDEQFIHGTLGYSDRSIIRFTEIRNQKQPLVIHRNLSLEDLDLSSAIFAGIIDNSNHLDELSVFEIPLDTFIFN